VSVCVPCSRCISPDASAKSLGAFVRETIVAGSILCTDGWRGYYGLSNEYEHRQTILSSSDDLAHVTMPGVHQVASLLKRWLLGTHQGAFAYSSRSICEGASSIVFGGVYVSFQSPDITQSWTIVPSALGAGSSDTACYAGKHPTRIRLEH
jgi:hypothetical protein